eukprot:scaffold2740_cov418-Prasinococcus_capsulatus_cf.AAC.28
MESRNATFKRRDVGTWKDRVRVQCLQRVRNSRETLLSRLRQTDSQTNQGEQWSKVLADIVTEELQRAKKEGDSQGEIPKEDSSVVSDEELQELAEKHSSEDFDDPFFLTDDEYEYLIRSGLGCAALAQGPEKHVHN